MEALGNLPVVRQHIGPVHMFFVDSVFIHAKIHNILHIMFQ